MNLSKPLLMISDPHVEQTSKAIWYINNVVKPELNKTFSNVWLDLVLEVECVC